MMLEQADEIRKLENKKFCIYAHRFMRCVSKACVLPPETLIIFKILNSPNIIQTVLENRHKIGSTDNSQVDALELPV